MPARTYLESTVDKVLGERQPLLLERDNLLRGQQRVKRATDLNRELLAESGQRQLPKLDVFLRNRAAQAAFARKLNRLLQFEDTVELRRGFAATG